VLSDRTLAILLRSPRSRALWGDLVRALIACVVMVVGSQWLTYDVQLFAVMRDELNMNDFGKFFYAARHFLAGQDMYGPSPATAIPIGSGRIYQFLNLNPPHFHLLLLPIAPLPPPVALTIWSLASLLGLGFSVRVTLREVGRRVSPAAAVWGIFGTLAFAGTGALAVTGQLSWLLLVPITLAWQAARRQRWTRAGLWMGVGLSVKPFLAVFLLYFALHRKWRAIGAALLATAAAFAVGLLVFGWDTHASWLHALRRVDWPWPPMNASWYGLLSRAFVTDVAGQPEIAKPWLVSLLWLGGMSMFAALTLLHVKSGDSTRAIDRSFALVLLMAVLVSPLGWIYYVWLVMGPLFAAVSAWTNTTTPKRRLQISLFLLAVPALAWPLIAMRGGGGAPWWRVTIGSAYFWGTALLWASLVADDCGCNRTRSTLSTRRT
jgi:alpha-1,2-mannosyltransferase